MKRAFALFPVMLALLFISAPHPIGVFAGKSEKAHVRWIEFENGKLAYGSDQFGNRVPDFSSVGYHAVLDTYVPIGSHLLTFDDDHDLKVGDRVIVQWSMTLAFIHMIGMDEIPPRKDGRAVRQWPPTMALHFDRRIVTVEHTTQGER